ncbi:MAG: hypothetical protein ABIR03_09285 [Ginsengibacter sp.]
MSSKMQSDMNRYQSQPKPQPQEPVQKKEEDYIEFEEVKTP